MKLFNNVDSSGDIILELLFFVTSLKTTLSWWDATEQRQLIVAGKKLPA